MKKTNVFVDMDGVLAVYDKDTSKHMYTKGFFLNRPKIESMISLVKFLIQTGEYNVYILSSVIDSPYAIPEKEIWLDNNLPEMIEDNRIFVPYGAIKAEYVKGKLDLNGRVNVLIDDYTNNLVKWNVPSSLPIKVLNGINSTNNTWSDLKGEFIAIDDNLFKNLEHIESLIKNREREAKL